jgi:hypothetical protein
MMAGDAIVTLKNVDTGNRVTYRIAAREDGKFDVRVFSGSDNARKGHYSLIGVMGKDGAWAPRSGATEVRELRAAIKAGPKGHWVDDKPGFLNSSERSLRAGRPLSKNQEFRYNSACRKYGVCRKWAEVDSEMAWKVLPWVWNRMESGKGLPESVEVWHEGACVKCAKRLTVPASIELGFGPDCAKTLGIHGEWKLLDKKLGRDLVAYASSLAA